jgi:hypothetical protein
VESTFTPSWSLCSELVAVAVGDVDMAEAPLYDVAWPVAVTARLTPP